MPLSKNVSVCMIAKNCADIIDTSLRWAVDNFEEINIVVDTENADGTRNMVMCFADAWDSIHVKFHKFDNFSAQKNRAFEMATRPWVLSVDSDEIYEQDVEWDRLTESLDRSKIEVASFQLYNLQKDLDHYLPPILPKIRLIKRNIAKMDGRLVDEGLDFANRKTIHFPYAHIHFGHVRTEVALKQKGVDRVVYKQTDPCDGPGLTQFGDDWFIKRNESWDQRVTRVPRTVRETINKYWIKK